MKITTIRRHAFISSGKGRRVLATLPIAKITWRRWYPYEMLHGVQVEIKLTWKNLGTLRRTSPTVPLPTTNGHLCFLAPKTKLVDCQFVSVALKRCIRSLKDRDLQYIRFQVYESNFSWHPFDSDVLRIQMVARDKTKNFPIYLSLAYFSLWAG